MERSENETHAVRLRTANARLLTRYAHWSSHMLTVTFKGATMGSMPSTEQVHAQLRHMQATLNSKVWKNKTQQNDKCRILFIPVIEGTNTSTRIHAHILLGNVKSNALVQEYIREYIPKSNWLAPRYDIRDVYDGDGVAWYLAKEVACANADAVAWQLASIPRPLMP